MANKSIKGITIELNGDSTKLVKALSGVESKSNKVQSELKEIDALLKFNPKNTELLAQKQTLLKERVEATSDKLKTLKDAQAEVTEQFKKGEIGEDAYRGFQRELIETESKLKHYSKTLKEATSLSKKFQDATKVAGEKVKQVGSNITDMGGKMTAGVTAPLAGIAAASYAAFNEVDSAVDSIITKTGASGEQLEEFETVFKNMSGTIPVEMQKIGDSIGEVNTQFGLQGKELEDASRYLIQYAEINGTDVSKSAIMSKQAMEAYGLTVNDLNGILDSTTKVAQNTGVSVEDLMQKTIDGAPQIKALGLGFDEAITLMGQFEQAGVDSSAALSSLSRASVVYAKDGKTLEEGLQDTIKSIQNASSETEALTIASEVFGTKGASRMVDAIKRGTFSLEELKTTAETSGGVVGQTFEETLDHADQMKNVMNELKEVGNELNLALQDVLAPMLERLIDIIRSVSEWFNSLDDSQKQTIVVIGLVVTAIGPLLMIIGSVISAFGTFITIMGAVLSPAGLVVAAIAAVVAAGVALWQNWDSVKAWANELWTSVSTDFNNIATSVKTAMDNAWQWVKDGVQKLKDAFNFSWSLPKIKLPHFSISGRFSLNPPSIPKFGVEWYKKGGILTKPTAFGMNGNNLMVGGEAGKEAVLPLNEKNLAMIGAGIAKALGGQQQTAQKTGDLVIQIDGMELMRILNPYSEIVGGENYRLADRGLARS
ncbi:phage tail tape measure protein [Globicatella sulfidifaciens]